MTFPDHMDKTEQRIASKLIKKALAAGYAVSVYDGEEWALKCSTSYDAICAEVAATDQTHLRFVKPFVNGPEALVIGTVFLVHGNGEDLISDHSDNEAMNDFMEDFL